LNGLLFGPVDRLKPLPDVEAYRFADIGSPVGVCGREVVELDIRVCGRRRVLELSGGVLNDGDVGRVDMDKVELPKLDGAILNDVGACPFEGFRCDRNLSLSLRGEGESSIMRTQPDESSFLDFLSLSLSWLLLDSAPFLVDSTLVFAIEEPKVVEEEVTGVVGVGIRLVMLPMRSLGTRV